ncbi:MAG: hypothetical protein EXS10_05620 [Phycisphaerales bacterium]|nr:hypothetical protein [Phycisphaerales bacterium]
MTCVSRSNLRSFVLIAVLIALAVALLAAAGAIAIARGAIADTRGGTRSALARAAALDGVTLVSATLAESRRELLQGGSPPSFPARDGEVLERILGEERLVARLVPFEDGTFFEAESGKFAIEGATDLVLEQLLESAAGEMSVVKLREQLASGSIEALALTQPKLSAMLTRFAADPMLDDEGLPRVLLEEALDDASTQRLRRLGSDAFLRVAARASKDKEGDEASFESRIVRALHAEALSLEQWNGALLSMTLIDGDRVSGRVSVNHASVAVLRVIEGIGAERAARIVEERALLSLHERRGAAWLVERGIVTHEEFVVLASRVTARSLQWRFRLEASFEPLEQTTAGASTHTPSRNTARFDCVIDCAQEMPRIALLRDTSMLEAFSAIAAKSAVYAAESEVNAEGEQMLQELSAAAAVADNAFLDFTEVTFSNPDIFSPREDESDKIDPLPNLRHPLGAPAVGRWVSSRKPR